MKVYALLCEYRLDSIQFAKEHNAMGLFHNSPWLSEWHENGQIPLIENTLITFNSIEVKLNRKEYHER